MKVEPGTPNISRRLATFAVLLLATAAGYAQAPHAVDLPNRKDALEGITSAGQPSAEQLAAAAEAGYKTVIDLRTPTEDRGFDEAATVEKAGMAYHALPVKGQEGVTYANAAELDKLLAHAERPVLLHCSTGNRVGALLALRAKLDHADAGDALALGEAAGLKGLKGTVEEKLAAGHD